MPGRVTLLSAIICQQGVRLSTPQARQPQYHHPVNVAHYDNATRAQRIADSVTAFMGSWVFIIFQTVIVLLWLGANIWLLSRPFDPFPFILLNLAFSTQAVRGAADPARREPAVGT